MTLFRTQHDHAECVVEDVNTILQLVGPEVKSLIEPRTVSLGSHGSQITIGNDMRPGLMLTRPSNWPDIFIKDPLFYLRLSFLLDIALSHGRSPHVADLPLWAVSSFLGSNSPSIPRLLEPYPWPQLATATSHSAEQSRVIDIGEYDEAIPEDCKYFAASVGW